MKNEQAGENLPGLEVKKDSYSSLVLCSRNDYDEISSLRAAQLDEFLIRAINTVPYFREQPERYSGITHNNLYQFPLIPQEDLLQDPYRFFPPDSKVTQLTSSGGTYGKRKLLFRTDIDTEKV